MLKLFRISPLIIFMLSVSCSNQNISTQLSQDSMYKLYVQFTDKKNLQKGDFVKLNGETIGSVVGFDENPDAYIVHLSIHSECEIPLLSKFRILTDTGGSAFVDVKFSDDERMLRNNEYFLGAE